MSEKPVFVVFDGPPAPEAGRFIEVETAEGKSVRAGEWEQDGDYWYLGPFYQEPPDVYALRAELTQARADIAERVRLLEGALEWYANPEIYKPHPHGIAFDNRDLSYHARAVLSAPTEG